VAFELAHFQICFSFLVWGYTFLVFTIHTLFFLLIVFVFLFLPTLNAMVDEIFIMEKIKRLQNITWIKRSNA